MSELVWDIKNGELESVKKEIENKVLFFIESRFHVPTSLITGAMCLLVMSRVSTSTRRWMADR